MLQEKANAYDKALKKASIAYKVGDKHLKATLERIFPELIESEDERIRKDMIIWLKGFIGEASGVGYTEDEIKERIAYLEKQGKKKPTDVELRFKVGDWVVNKFGYVWHVDSFDKKNYQVSNGKDLEDCYFKISDQDEFHLWTIDDAKDGDVLAIGNEYFLFKGKIEHKSSVYISYCFLDSAGAFRVTNGVDCGEFFPIENGIKVHPATKEQRNLLFRKMKEAGYEWDDIEKLKRI